MHYRTLLQEKISQIVECTYLYLKKLLSVLYLKDLTAFFRQYGKGFILTCKAKYKRYSLEIESDLIAFGARWCKAVKFMFFSVDVSFKLIILSREAIFSWLSIYLSKHYCTEGCSSGSGVAWWGSVRAKKQLAAEECFFLTPLWCVVAIQPKTPTLYHLTFWRRTCSI